MKGNDNSSAIIISGTIATCSSLVALSFEIMLKQFFRFYLFINGITGWTANSAENSSRATSASDIISTSWISFAFIITGIVALLGVVLLFIGFKARTAEKASASKQ